MAKTNQQTAAPIEHPATRTKRDKFVAMAESRTGNAIKAIRLIGNLGNRASYEYGELDVRKIINALTSEVEAVRAKMSLPTGQKSDVNFKL